jgi:aminomethyltransferase
MPPAAIPTRDGRPVTPLHDEHVRQGARIVEFGGWLMPVQYQSILAEHDAVRTSAGAFDLSHMGRVFLRGPDARPLAQWVFANNVDALSEGKAQYSLVCNEDGGVLDDVIVYDVGDALLVVFNASNREQMVDWLERQAEARGFSARVDDQTPRIAMVGVQGPRSEQVVQALCDVDLSALGYYAFRRGRVLGEDALLARTGYTGEDGFEILLPAERGPELWRVVTEGVAAVRPCGLGARDTLRLEAGMPLYGHELDDSVTPYQAGLGRVVKLGKGDFVGRAALERAKGRTDLPRLAGFRMLEPAVARQGYEVQSEGRVVGRVTSGSPSPTLKANIGMAYLEPDLAEVGRRIDVVVRGRPTPAEVVPVPFVPHHTRKKQPEKS